MSYTDETYFVGTINIPGGDLSNLTNEIARQEPVLLKKLLGYELCKLLSTETSQRITDLIGGKEYTVNYNGRDQIIKWNGFQNAEKVSLLAYYTYYWWHRINITHTSKLGEVKNKTENSAMTSGNEKAVKAWFDMRQLYGYYGQEITAASCYNFLVNHADDYPELIFTEIGKINAFGI